MVSLFGPLSEVEVACGHPPWQLVVVVLQDEVPGGALGQRRQRHAEPLPGDGRRGRHRGGRGGRAQVKDDGIAGRREGQRDKNVKDLNNDKNKLDSCP